MPENCPEQIPTEDRILIERVATMREEEAFDQLAARYREPLTAYLKAHLNGDRSTADDLLQETLLRLWTRADSYDGRGPVKAWLFRIAGNLMLNHRRTVARRRESDLALPEDTGAEEDATLIPARLLEDAAQQPDALAVQAEEREQLRRLVSELPEDSREMLRLVMDEEAELRTVAARLGVPEGTVKSRLFYTRKRLARALRAGGEDRD